MSTNPDDLLDDVDTGDDDTDTSTPGENSTIKELRSAYRRAERSRKANETELAELRQFKQEYDGKVRTETVSKLFEEAQLNPAHAKLFLALNPDVEPTAEAVKAFASENQLTTTTGEEVPPPADGFEPPSGFNPPQVQRYTQEQFRDLQRNNPEAARRALEKGLVEPVDVPWSTAPMDWQGTS